MLDWQAAVDIKPGSYVNTPCLPSERISMTSLPKVPDSTGNSIGLDWLSKVMVALVGFVAISDSLLTFMVNYTQSKAEMLIDAATNAIAQQNRAKLLPNLGARHWCMESSRVDCAQHSK